MNELSCVVEVSANSTEFSGLGPESRLYLDFNREKRLVLVKKENGDILGSLKDHVSDFLLSHRDVKLQDIRIRPSEISIPHHKSGSGHMRIYITLPE